MDKKELQKKIEMLTNEIKKEKAKLHGYEKQLALYEFKEPEAKKPEAKKPAPKKKAAKKPAAKKAAPKKATKPVQQNKPAPALTPIVAKNEGANKKNMKKHTIVPMSVYEKYEYEQRKKDWHKYSGMNEKQIVCDVCKDDDNFETVLLENGNHLCYYCWVKKPVALTAKTQEKKSPAPIAKVETKPTEVKKPVETKKPADQKKAEGNPIIFAVISVSLGVLLVCVILAICLGIITGWEFRF